MSLFAVRHNPTGLGLQRTAKITPLITNYYSQQSTVHGQQTN
ncbi:hypothetical protein QUA70_16185 [Microcoleus sp. LAD1_D5]